MLTARGWWLLMVAGPLTVLGFLIPHGFPMAALGLAVLSWFAWEWAGFTRSRFALDRLRIRRRVLSGGGEVSTLWAGRPVTVRLELTLPAGHAIPLLIVEDRLPWGSVLLAGEARRFVRLTSGEPATLEYQIGGADPGVVRFEGVRVDVADFQGFFHYHAVVRDPMELPVLPPLVNADGGPRTDKRHNLLLPPGTHRMRRPGSGSELLDLRDYRPGDPPKMIAWKASARRDKLITKEFESEVPIRCTLYVDTSASVRLGPPGRNPMARLIGVAASVAQAAAADRDLIGLTIFDEESAEIVAPARGSRHLIGLMVRLARAARLRPAGGEADLPELTRLGLRLADEVYPDLMRSEVNTLPWKMYWRPLLDARWGWLVLAILATPLAILWEPVRSLAARTAGAIAPEPGLVLPIFILLALSPALLGLAVWAVYGLSGWFLPAVRRIGQRKRLAAIVSQHAKLGAGGTALLCEDDAAYARHVQTFLGDHLAPYPVKIFDSSGRYQFRSPEKAGVLARALTRGVGRAHDNELFVVFADLFELGDELEPILKAVRLALARHHEVLVISPWLTGMPEPDEDTPAGRDGPALPKQLRSAAVDRIVTDYHRAYSEVRRAFGRLGVPVVRVNQGEPVKLILERLDRLRGVPSRR